MPGNEPPPVSVSLSRSTLDGLAALVAIGSSVIAILRDSDNHLAIAGGIIAGLLYLVWRLGDRAAQELRAGIQRRDAMIARQAQELRDLEDCLTAVLIELARNAGSRQIGRVVRDPETGRIRYEPAIATPPTFERRSARVSMLP